MSAIGLKLWSTNANYYEAAKALYAGGVYDYVELYAVPDTTDQISFWKTLRVPYVIHAPHYGSGLNFSNPDQAASNQRLALQAMEFADALNAPSIIFHPGINGTLRETIRQLKQMSDPRILVENKPHRGLDGSTCVGSRPEEIQAIMTECGVGFCLDMGHAICAANSFGKNQMQWLDTFNALKPTMYHLTDGDGASELDSHKHFGEGTYDVKALLTLIDTQKRITLETEKSNLGDLDDFVPDVHFLRQQIGGGFFLRTAGPQDLMAIYQLSNSPEVRRNSITQDEIPLDSHKAWYVKSLANDNLLFYILETEKGEFAGQIRLELDPKGWLISISIVKNFCGQGLGHWAIAKASSMAQAVCDHPILAYIQISNSASTRAFEKAGFLTVGQEVLGKETYFRLEKPRWAYEK